MPIDWLNEGREGEERGGGGEGEGREGANVREWSCPPPSLPAPPSNPWPGPLLFASPVGNSQQIWARSSTGQQNRYRARSERRERGGGGWWGELVRRGSLKPESIEWFIKDQASPPPSCLPLLFLPTFKPSSFNFAPPPLLLLLVRLRSKQRVLKDLWRTRPTRRRIIWLLLHPRPPPYPVSKLYRWHTGRLRKRDNLLTGGEGGGAKSYDGENLVLYKS